MRGQCPENDGDRDRRRSIQLSLYGENDIVHVLQRQTNQPQEQRDLQYIQALRHDYFSQA